jgi:uncharacterized protein (TIGR03437 family)
MALRGLLLSVAALSGCAAMLNAQTLPTLPSCLAFDLQGQSSPACAVGSSFSYDFGQLFDLSEIVSIIGSNGSGIGFMYSFAVTGGTLPTGLSLSQSGLLSGTFTQGGNFAFSLTLTWAITIEGQSYPFSFPFPLTMDITGSSGPPLSVNPTGLSFNLTQNGSASTQSVSVFNNTAQAVQVSATASTSGNWLSVSSVGSVPAYSSATVAITANPTQLGPGTYPGTVTVSVAGGSTTTVSVLAVVTSGQPNLLLSQTGLFFDAVQGGSSSGPQTISILNSGSGALNYTVAASTISGGDWLSVSSSSGSTSGSSAGSVMVSVNPTGLQPGAYYGKITILASGAANSPQVASVVLDVVTPDNSPGASVEPAGMIFVASANGANPAAQTLSVTNPSPEALSFLVTPFSNGNISWLSATPASGSVSATQPGTVSVQPSLQGLTAGLYLGSLSITIVPANTASTSPPQVLQVEVLLIVLPTGETPAVRAGPRPRATTCTPTQLIPVFTLLGTGFSSTVGWPTEIEVTAVDDCGNPLLDGSVTVTFSNGDPALSLTSIGGGSWTATWGAANVASNVTITAQVQELTPALTGKASIGGTLKSNNAVPSVATGGIVSAANFLANQPLAPGSFGAIFGTNLSQGLVGATQLPLTNQLGSTSVVLAGQEMPLLFASSGQINMVVPYDVPVNTLQQLVVQMGSAISIPQSVAIAPAVPAIFTQNGAGTGAAIVQAYKSDGTPLPLNSAVSGGDVIVLYCSGMGAVNPPIAAGSQTPLSPLSNTVNAATVTIGGKQQKAAFAGLTPTFVQLYQVNVTIPSVLPSGSATVTLSVAGQQSAPVTITIQ